MRILSEFAATNLRTRVHVLCALFCITTFGSAMPHATAESIDDAKQLAALQPALDRSLALHTEIDAYQRRADAIRRINRGRHAWAKRLDELCGIAVADNTPETYRAVLQRLKMERPSTGEPTLRIYGHMHLAKSEDAPGQLSLFYRGLTEDWQEKGQPSHFYQHFASIELKSIDATPQPAAPIRFELTRKPVEPAPERDDTAWAQDPRPLRLDAQLRWAQRDIAKTPARERMALMLRNVEAWERRILPREAQRAEIEGNLAMLERVTFAEPQIAGTPPTTQALAGGLVATRYVRRYRGDEKSVLHFLSRLEKEIRAITFQSFDWTVDQNGQHNLHVTFDALHLPGVAPQHVDIGRDAKREHYAAVQSHERARIEPTHLAPNPSRQDAFSTP